MTPHEVKLPNSLEGRSCVYDQELVCPHCGHKWEAQMQSDDGAIYNFVNDADLFCTECDTEGLYVEETADGPE